MIIRLTYLIIIISICFNSYGQERKETIKNSVTTIQDTLSFSELLEKIRKQYNIPAIAAAVLKSDTILECNVAGVRNIFKKDKAEINDRFHLGSNSKAITVFIAGKLVEQGLFSWNTKFFDLFPELKNESKKVYHNITLEDLLSHRAGIKSFIAWAEFEKLPDFQGNDSEKRFAFSKWLLKQNRDRSFFLNIKDRGFAYSNAGYSIASVMLEKVSGKSWKELITTFFADSLNIEVGFGWPNKISKDQPWGHWVENRENTILTSLPPDHEYEINSLITPAGDLNMTIKDYAKFIQLNLQGIRGKDNFLKAETYNYIHFGKTNYSMGWLNTEKEGKHISTHNGSAGTFYCRAIIIKELDLALIIMTNSAGENTKDGISELEEIIIKKYGT